MVRLQTGYEMSFSEQDGLTPKIKDIWVGEFKPTDMLSVGVFFNKDLELGIYGAYGKSGFGGFGFDIDLKRVIGVLEHPLDYLMGRLTPCP